MVAEIYPSAEEKRKVVRKVEKPMDNEDTGSCAYKFLKFGGNERTLDSIVCLCTIFSGSL